LSILGFKKAVRWFNWPIVLIIAILKVIAYCLSLVPYPKILVLEMAANKPGDIGYLTSFVKPKIGVITAIGLAHTEFFKNLRNIIQEKSKLIESLPQNGYAVLNKNDTEVRKMASRTRAKVVYYYGRDFDSAQQAARAVGKIYGLSEKQISRALISYKPLPHRMNILKGIKNTFIIDDCYNANPLSMERALKKIKNEKPKIKNSRKIAVLGDMLELGSYTDWAHREIIKKAGLISDLLILVGPEFKKAFDWLSKSLDKSCNVYPFKNSQESADFLLREIKRGDIILVKGSRGMKMEKIVKRLTLSK